MMTVIADVDTGIDDALALAFLARSPLVRLAAVTCVAGNAGVDQVVRNTLDVLALVGARDVPVARGADRPLVAEPAPAHGWHGANGIGGLELPRSPRPAEPLTAVDLVRQVVAAGPEPVTLLALGPLTNVAHLIRTAPRLCERVERVLFMGGTIGAGNATPLAEFNAWQDPEAVSVVVNGPVAATMYGLDVFYAPVVEAAQWRAREESEDDGTRLVGRLLAAHARTDPDVGAAERTGLGDAGAACLLADAGAGRTTQHRIGVGLSGDSRGQTYVDDDSAEAAEVDVVTGLDGPRVVEHFLRTVTRDP